MFEWQEYAMHLKPQEVMRHAEQQERVREALAARRTRRFYYTLLTLLGRWLASVGERLQDQYDTARQLSLEPPLDQAHHTVQSTDQPA